MTERKRDAQCESALIQPSGPQLETHVLNAFSCLHLR